MSDSIINLLFQGTIETIVMTLVSGFFGFVLGLPTGIFLFLARKGQLLENKISHQIVSIIVNIFRSIPFIILIVWMIPFTRTLVGMSIGVAAALVPLSVGSAPFIARLVENSLLEIPSGLIEASESNGCKTTSNHPKSPFAGSFTVTNQ